MYKVDLNSDLGESFGNYKIGLDEEVIQYVTSVNIACGWHGGDPLVMEKTVEMAKKRNVSIGAHPGYPDLIGFGRRNMTVSPKEVKAYVKYQLGALLGFAKKIQHVKPHGAMYNMAAKDYALAKAIAEAIYEVDEDIILMGLANSALIKAGEEVGIKVAHEVFADRAYNVDGTLVSRNLEGAVIHDPDVAIQRVIKMVREGKVMAISGEEINIQADSICVHGDNPKAVSFVKQIREKLEEEGVEVTAISNFIE
ncbi:LamB/YcsF family protein [Inediibacterium massiliense]|uniref:LamB/YcsF family protein n=1 Tax=Inediibacterium massiliense TaxID=1658111 RepID=UPI0006B4C78A|nr:5-oxoprolinase subunit PxpA [Inediibacterium massiliense]